MSYNYKTLVRDYLVNNAAVKTVFSATLTGSCRVNMENLRASASYPQILIGYGAGETTPGMDADESRIYLTCESKGSGTLHPYKEVGKLRSAIIGAIDDQSLSATSVCYHIRKFSEAEGYDEDKKVYWLRMGFTANFRQNTSLP
ncbi:MAG TPA: hypothetical protein VMV86_02555 [Methanosarcinales archaeon]|nr:hypothetical protein [Methanosarcinales archaeon]